MPLGISKSDKLKQFELWYEIYDYKKARIVAERAWLKIDPSLYPLIMEHTEQLVKVTYKDGTFPSRPFPSTYLNQMRWEDEITSLESEETFRDEMRRMAGE